MSALINEITSFLRIQNVSVRNVYLEKEEVLNNYYGDERDQIHPCMVRVWGIEVENSESQDFLNKMGKEFHNRSDVLSLVVMPHKVVLNQLCFGNHLFLV